MAKTRVPAPEKSVARVLPLLGLPHLDRLFDYRISEDQHDDVQPGVRVRVRFGGRLVDAIVIDRTSQTTHEGSLAYVDRVISPVVVYPTRTAKLIENLADRYGGVRSDLIRSAIPARHAGAEDSNLEASWESLGTVTEPDLSSWSAYLHGQSFVDAVLSGATARAAWQIAPGDDWALALASLAVKVVKDGGGALLVVPDQRDLDRLEAALRTLVSAKQITVLNSGLGPQARYRRFLSVLEGQGRLVIGTRSAAFAPVENLKLAVIVSDGDDNLVDPRAPYVHAREVLTTRSSLEGSSLIIGGHARTAETQLLVESGWMHDLVAPRETLRTRMPRIHAVGDSDVQLERDPLARSARLPGIAYKAVRAALERNQPVLIQVPRKGYVPTLACGQCKTPARCRHCNGPLGLPQGGNDRAAVPTCRWCGRPDSRFRCQTCGSPKLRAVVLGTERTAEELGRAFPSVRVITSGGNRIVDSVDNRAAIVVSTPGAEPYVFNSPGGYDGPESLGAYGALLLLDTWALMGRQDLRAMEDTLHKWASAATLVHSHIHHGEVVVVADASFSAVQSLIRWDMVGAAAKELGSRREVAFPPSVHMAAIDGATAALDSFIELAHLPSTAEILGPVDLPPGVNLPGEYDEQRFGPPQRMLIRTPLGPRSELGRALRAAQVARAARKNDLPLRIQMDPIHIG
ncbi:Putative primosomal protein N' [Corynebacterium deserti GIMN1.010]|uniref:Probable replication restart protein PriA n=1 Tax=Corynebacterium deserti GIMN1.010 TaxID=931089 RepID=A0A0M4CQ87_9CORY|nr:primosomal protein N' [Corynebacterium deserti]ALC06005.1 Putative primosomal protein N' [Corynebacterium deserti GIMN1.010]